MLYPGLVKQSLCPRLLRPWRHSDAQVASRLWVVRVVIFTVMLVVGIPAECTAGERPPILLFDGNGTSPDDVAALRAVLSRAQLRFDTADSPRLNAMSAQELRGYRLLIVPGGNFERIGNALTPLATASLRTAVRSGLNYLGVCAGAFFAGDSPYNGLNLTSGVRFGFYSLEARGVRKAAVPISIAGSGTFDHYWEDGPQLSGWGDVAARYPDGAPAVVEGLSGAGWVILVGVHPEAPAAWRRGLAFSSPVAQDNAYAETLIRAALAGTRGMVVIDPLTGAMFNLSPDKINQTLRPAEASAPR